MSETDVVVKYHNRRMLLTVDLNALFLTIFDEFGDEACVEFAPMNEQERSNSVDVVDGIRVVRDRFWILKTDATNGARRRRDLERAAVAIGQK